jgi:hypothetical protein
MKVPGGRLYQDSSLLGISEDKGKHWTFIDLGPITKDQLQLVFPELDGKITLPEKKQPVFVKDEKASPPAAGAGVPHDQGHTNRK